MSFDALAYDAPFLIEKLLKEHVVQSSQEGEALFAEVKKYLVLTQADNSKNWQMHSLRVDAVWHQFVLFTWEYTKFCKQFFGKYIHHAPSNAPKLDRENPVPESTFLDFQKRYQELFGIRLPDAWYDERGITPRQRVLNDKIGKLALWDDDGTVELMNERGHILLSVNDLARDALAFIAQTGMFIVRELPGELTDEEKVALVATLIQTKVLRVGA